jgi:hypothetical protein
MAGWVSMADVGRMYPKRGWDIYDSPTKAYEAHQSANGFVEKSLLSRIVQLLEENSEYQRMILWQLKQLPKEMTKAIAAGEERKAKAAQKRAAAELAAKQECPTVKIVQCPNEVLDRIAHRKLRGKW